MNKLYPPNSENKIFEIFFFGYEKFDDGYLICVKPHFNLMVAFHKGFGETEQNIKFFDLREDDQEFYEFVLIEKKGSFSNEFFDFKDLDDCNKFSTSSFSISNNCYKNVILKIRKSEIHDVSLGVKNLFCRRQNYSSTQDQNYSSDCNEQLKLNEKLIDALPHELKILKNEEINILENELRELKKKYCDQSISKIESDMKIKELQNKLENLKKKNNILKAENEQNLDLVKSKSNSYESFIREIQNDYEIEIARLNNIILNNQPKMEERENYISNENFSNLNNDINVPENSQ